MAAPKNANLLRKYRTSGSECCFKVIIGIFKSCNIISLKRYQSFSLAENSFDICIKSILLELLVLLIQNYILECHCQISRTDCLKPTMSYLWQIVHRPEFCCWWLSPMSLNAWSAWNNLLLHSWLCGYYYTQINDLIISFQFSLFV